MTKSEKIFLIGFMGSGKSTLGKKLANKLNKSFFDLDEEIEKHEGKTVAAIFEQHSEVYFRKLEKEQLNKITAENNDFVMALGGGTPCFYDNMDFINKNGQSIYLKYNSGVLLSRLINAKSERPLIKDKTENQLTNFIEEKLAQREKYYAKSKVIVEGIDLNLDELIKLL
jgi:shikimate kinase